MRISPEPLHPMRSWRDLWQSEPMAYDRAVREQALAAAAPWKNTKRTSFTWLSHLLNRQSTR